MIDRELELRNRLDELAAEFADLLGADDDGMPVCVGATLLTAWVDPTDPDDKTWVSQTDSTLTPLMTGIGIVMFAAARAVE